MRRATETSPPRATFRIYSEGSATEPEYIDALKRLAEFAGLVSLSIEVVERGKSPITLVEAARADKMSGSSDVDQYWCVFDVEYPKPHEHLAVASQIASSNEIKLAVSNPCFELWLVLHHQDQTAHLTTDAAIALRKKLDGAANKHLDADRYLPLRRAAIARARALRQRHDGNGTAFPNDNPSSGLDLLLGELDLAAARAMAEVADTASGDGA